MKAQRSSTLLATATSLLAGIAAAVSTMDKRQTAPAVVDLSTLTGSAESLAAGFIYGWPDNGVEADVSIPASLVTPINFIASRAGGAQLPAPALGWAAGGYDGYIGRFRSTLSNYRTTRRHNGVFILLPHDLWGSDGQQAGGTAFPGDNGDWTSMETFWNQVVKDLIENDMLEGLVIDVWNEPDIGSFWGRSWEQYLEYWVRAVRLLRAALPDTLLSGPSTASSPRASPSSQWRSYLALLAGAGNDTIPDIYAWHQLGDRDTEPDATVPAFHNLLKEYGLPPSAHNIDINEYAWPSEQNVGTSAWFFGQLERHNVRGLRAHWGSAGALHDTMANIIFPVPAGTGVDGSSYLPNGEWHVYKYYADMSTGNERVKTTASGDRKFDVFATVDDDAKVLKLLAGARSVDGAYGIAVRGLPVADGGDVSVRAIRFDWNGPTATTAGAVDLGTTTYKAQGASITIPVSAKSGIAYAFEINLS
ncbi:polysaccharide biosynthesis protein PslG [Microdochium nivale]|nr:polysaccharide biosynthesis protein PslG [Microdochium nivale]